MGKKTTIISQAKPSQAKPSQAKPSQAKPSQAKPSQALGKVRPFFVVNSEITILYFTEPLFLRKLDIS